MNSNRPLLLVQRGSKDKQLRIDQYLPSAKRQKKQESTVGASQKKVADGATISVAPAAAIPAAQPAAIAAAAVDSGATSSAPACEASGRCQISSLSLESYIQLYAALTKGTGVVQQVTSIEEPFYKITDLKALLDVHGLLFTRNKKKELLDRLEGLRLAAPAQQAADGAQQQQGSVRPPQASGTSVGDLGQRHLPAPAAGADGEQPLTDQQQQEPRLRQWQMLRVPESPDVAALATWATAASTGGGSSSGAAGCGGTAAAQQALQDATAAAAAVDFAIPEPLRALAAAPVGGAAAIEDEALDLYEDKGATDLRAAEQQLEGAPEAVNAKAEAAAMASPDDLLPAGAWTVDLHPNLDLDPDSKLVPDQGTDVAPAPWTQKRSAAEAAAGGITGRSSGPHAPPPPRSPHQLPPQQQQQQRHQPPDATSSPQPESEQRHRQEQQPLQQRRQPGTQQIRQLLLPLLQQQQQDTQSQNHSMLTQLLQQLLLSQQQQQEERLQQQQQQEERLQQQQKRRLPAVPVHSALGGPTSGRGRGDGAAATTQGRQDVLYADGSQQQVLVLGMGGGDAGGADGGDADNELYGSGAEMLRQVAQLEDGEEAEEADDARAAGAVEVDPEGEDGAMLTECGGRGGSQSDDRPAVSVLQWLAPEVIGISQAHSASAEPLISSGQLLGRRVAFALLSQFTYMDARAGEEVLPPGVYLGRVTERLGTGCQPDVCGEVGDERQYDGPDAPALCPRAGDHDFFFVRVMTQPHLGIRGRLELKLDLSPAHRVTSFQQLVGLTMGQLQDAWVLIGGPAQPPEGPTGHGPTGRLADTEREPAGWARRQASGTGAGAGALQRMGVGGRAGAGSGAGLRGGRRGGAGGGGSRVTGMGRGRGGVAGGALGPQLARRGGAGQGGGNW